MRVTAPPFHVYCRSTTVPYFDDDFDIGERAARDENGKTYYVPDDMSYKEWKETFVDGKTQTKNNVQEVEKEVAKDEKIGYNNIDYMSNSFRPKYGEETINKVGNVEIPIKRVTNSKFELYTDVENTEKNKAVRLTEKNLAEVGGLMPGGFVMPKTVVVDFEKYNLNKTAIGGYLADTKTMYINSKYNTPEKIISYVNGAKGYFSNSTALAPYLHELGHKQYEDRLIKYANKNNISVDRARNIVENKLSEYLGDKRKIDENFIKDNISKYADNSYESHKYSEVFAECFSAEKQNDITDKILSLLKEVD